MQSPESKMCKSCGCCPALTLGFLGLRQKRLMQLNADKALLKNTTLPLSTPILVPFLADLVTGCLKHP